MTEGPEIVVLQHPKECRKKCTLQPFRTHTNFRFQKWKHDQPWDVGGMTVLTLDAPVISPADRDRPLLILDGTWRLVGRLEASLVGDFVRRSLPPDLVTAYPRKALDGTDPSVGLASIEALAAAAILLGFDGEALLETYRWGTEFIEANPTLQAAQGTGSA